MFFFFFFCLSLQLGCKFPENLETFLPVSHRAWYKAWYVASAQLVHGLQNP